MVMTDTAAVESNRTRVAPMSSHTDISPAFGTSNFAMSMKPMPAHLRGPVDNDVGSRRGEAILGAPSPAAADLMGVRMRFARNTEIYGDGEPAEYVYQVLRGAVRAYKMISDGRRQVSAFYLPGDIFGLELTDKHSCSAEAIADCDVLMVKRSAILALAKRNSDVANRLWSVAATDLHRSQNHILLLAKSAQGRVAGFLLEMADRLHTEPAVDLPMTRQDIADYLGLAIETISRTLTEFKGAATIDLPASRRVVLRDRSALRRLNG